MALPDKDQVLDSASYRGEPYSNVYAYRETRNLGYRGRPFVVAMGSGLPPPPQYQPQVVICM